MKIKHYPEWKVLTSYSPQLLFELPDAEGLLLAEVNRDGVITYVNPEAVNRLGWLENQLLPEPIWQTLQEERKPTSLTPENELLLLAIPLPDGWFLIGYRIEDVTDLSYAAALLAELRSLVEHAPLFIAHLSPEGQILTASQFARSLIEIVQPASWVDIFHPDDQLKVARSLQEAEVARHVQLQTRLQVAAGVYEPFEVYLRPVHTAAGMAVEVIGIPLHALEALQREKEEVEQQLAEFMHKFEASQQEVQALRQQLLQSEEERQQMERRQKDILQQVADKEARLAQIDKLLLQERSVFYHFLEHLPFPIIEIDSDSKITYLNSRAIKLFQLGRTSGALALSAIPGMEKVFSMHVQQWLKDSSRASTGEVVIEPGKRGKRDIRFFGISLPDGDMPGRHFFILEDLTEQKKLFQEAFLQKKYHDAELELLQLARQVHDPGTWFTRAFEIMGKATQADRVRLFVLDAHLQAFVPERHWMRSEQHTDLQVAPVPVHGVPATAFAHLQLESPSKQLHTLAERLHSQEVIIARFQGANGKQYLLTLEHERGSNLPAWSPVEHPLMERLTAVFQTALQRLQWQRREEHFLQAPIPFLVYRLIDRDQIQMEEVSPALLSMTGYERVSFLARDFLDIVYEEDQDEVLEHWARLQTQNTSSVEFRLHHMNGELVWIREDARILGENGSARVYAHWQDISKVFQIEQELQEARREAGAIQHLKSTFLATMSHEIRTPLGAIKGYADLLASELSEWEETTGQPLPPQIIEFARSIRRNGQQALELINELFDYIQIETGMLKLRNVSTPIHEIIMRATGQIAVELSQKGVDLRLKLASEEPVVIGDPDRLEQIIEHLLSNAAKFTREGSVTVRTEHLGKEVLVEIADTGIGMSQEFLDQLFTPFSQEDHGLNRHFGGKGLSLALVKRLLDLMEGRIEVESEKGRGTTFRLYLPTAVHAWASPSETVR